MGTVTRLRSPQAVAVLDALRRLTELALVGKLRGLFYVVDKCGTNFTGVAGTYLEETRDDLGATVAKAVRTLDRGVFAPTAHPHVEFSSKGDTMPQERPAADGSPHHLRLAQHIRDLDTTRHDMAPNLNAMLTAIIRLTADDDTVRRLAEHARVLADCFAQEISIIAEGAGCSYRAENAPDLQDAVRSDAEPPTALQ